MKILIADDEAPARKRLVKMIEALEGEYCVVAEAANGQEVIEQCRATLPHVALLDIRMPGMDGMQATMQLSQLDNPPSVIFTTAYEEHALQAFDVDAIDYLLKPIRKDRLQRALEKVKGTSSFNTPFLTVSYRGGLKRITLDQVRYLKADNKYVEVGFDDGFALLEESLISLEQQYSHYFVRIHRNALVAPKAMNEMVKRADGRHVLILDGLPQGLEISRRHLSEVKRVLSHGI